MKIVEIQDKNPACTHDWTQVTGTGGWFMTKHRHMVPLLVGQFVCHNCGGMMECEFYGIETK